MSHLFAVYPIFQIEKTSMLIQAIDLEENILFIIF